MEKIKSILRFLPMVIFIVAVIALFNSYGDMQKVRPADEYKDMGVYTFYPQRVIPLQKETNFSGKRNRRQQPKRCRSLKTGVKKLNRAKS